jgi:hypothetical protein
LLQSRRNITTHNRRARGHLLDRQLFSSALSLPLSLGSGLSRFKTVVMTRLVILIVIFFMVISNCSRAQTYSLPRSNFSAGLIACEFGYDMGIGVEVGTPCLRQTALCFRIKGTTSWLEHYKSRFDRWATYKSLNVSMIYNFYTMERSRAYADIGTYVIFPDAKFSQQRSVQGVTASTGLELFVITNPKFHVCYYFSGGIAHARAYADKLENKPRYGNGFVFTNGFRFYF